MVNSLRSRFFHLINLLFLKKHYSYWQEKLCAKKIAFNQKSLKLRNTVVPNAIILFLFNSNCRPLISPVSASTPWNHCLITLDKKPNGPLRCSFWPRREFDRRIHVRRNERDEGGEEVQERRSGSTPRGINRGDVITEINAALSFRWQPKLPVLAFISRAIIRSRFSSSRSPSPPESNLRTRGNGFKFYLSVGLRFTCVADAAGGQPPCPLPSPRFLQPTSVTVRIQSLHNTWAGF